MAERPDAQDGQLDEAEFNKKLLSQLQTRGVVGQVKSQLRAQLLSQLQKGQIVQLGPPPGDRPGLKRHALNSMIADYLGKVQYNYSLSVFKEESGVESRPLLTEDELLDVLKVDRETSFFQSYMKSKAHGGSDSCFILNLLSAISEAAAAKGKESFTQTIGGDRYQLEVRMKQLEDEYQAKLRAARMAPGAGLEERMALYRQEIEEQAAAEVARQVERIREMEVAAARLDEAAKARRAMEAERLELDRLHGERLAKLRQREEEMMDKLRRQQRDVENVAYEHRQRILREEERMRNQRTELQQQQDARQEQLRQLERSLELRERAVAAREAAAERKLAEATEAAAEAQVAARQDVEREYMELKNGLAQQRMQIEMDRSRILELRSEATAEIAAARAKEERLRALEAARAEAEARAAAHAADAEICRLQAEKLALELSEARDELSRRLAQAADGADAMLANAAGAMNMLNAEAVASRSAGSQIREAMVQMERTREEANAAKAAVAQLQQECASLREALAASGKEAEFLRSQLGRVEALLDEAVAARADALSSYEEAQFRMFQLERELADVRGALAKAKEEAAALRMQAAAQRRPPSRGADSPGRRSVTLSPGRRASPSATSAAISALNLGIALGAGSGGTLVRASVGSGGGGGQTQHGWHWQQSGGGSSGGVPGAAPSLSHVEFSTAAVPRDATTERHERLRRQEDIVAGQEDTYRKRMVQEVRNSSLAVLGQTSSGGAGGYQSRYPAPQQQLLQLHAPPQRESFGAVVASAQAPYMTYVMHGSPTHHQRPSGSAAAPGADYNSAHHQQYHQSSPTYQQQQQQYPARSAYEERIPDQQQEAYMQNHEGQQGHHGQAPVQHHYPQRDDRQPSQQPSQQPPQQQQQPQYLSNQFQEQLFEAQRPHTADAGAPPPAHTDWPLSQHNSYDSQQQQHQGKQNQPQPNNVVKSEFPPHSGGPLPYGAAKSPPPGQEAVWGASLAQWQRSMREAEPTPAGAAPPPPHEASYSDCDDSSGGGLQHPVRSMSNSELPSHAQPPDHSRVRREGFAEPVAEPPVAGDDAAFAPGGRVDSRPAPAPAATPPVILPPPGLVITNTFAPPPPAPGAPFEPAAEEPPPPPPKPTIPGLVMVSGFTPRPAASGPQPVAAAQQQAPPPAARPPSPPGSVHDVESMKQAKMRMLQEQRERAMAAQQQQQDRRPRLTSQSSRASDASSTGGGAGGGNLHRSHSHSQGPSAQPSRIAAGGGGAEREDSSSALMAGEALDTVAPELSSLQRRTGGGRRTSLEGGHLSRQSSSLNRRDLARHSSVARSEASGFSVEGPGAGNSARALSVNMTLDDIPSSMEGFELPGLNDDDDDEEGVEAPGDDSRFGAFAAEFSAGSVF